jgi:hypothetical protein
MGSDLYNYQNGKPKHKEVAVSLHTVLDKTPPFERIVFEKLVRTAGDKSSDMSKQLAKFPPCEASIAKGAGAKALALPDLSGWDMKVVGVITDLHTFLVAVSPQAGVDKLAEVNSQHTLPKPVIASWANGSNVADASNSEGGREKAHQPRWGGGIIKLSVREVRASMGHTSQSVRSCLFWPP